MMTSAMGTRVSAPISHADLEPTLLQLLELEPPPAGDGIDLAPVLRARRAGDRLRPLLFQRREYLNRINVFPVPDGDTGTNMAFTFKTILEAVSAVRDDRVDTLMACIADAALDGARGDQPPDQARHVR